LAVLFRKPIMLIATRDYYELTPFHSRAFDQVAEALGTPLHFIDRPLSISLQSALNFNSRRYDKYVRFYLRHPDAPQALLWDIAFDAIDRSLRQSAQTVH
jgi:hypothetical protein